MVLFVVATLVVFSFSLPAGTEEEAAYGLLWVALLFTAILGLTRAFAAEREQRVLDGLILAPCDRSAIWLGKAIAVVTFLALAEVVALPAFALFFEPLTWELVVAVVLADLGLAAVGHTPCRDGGRQPGAGAASSPAAPAARDSDRGRWGRRLDLRRPRPLPRLPRSLRRHLCDPVLGEL